MKKQASQYHKQQRVIYEQHYKKKRAFSFGKNWKTYLATVTEEKIAEAQKSLRELLGLEDLHDKSFLDVGCGSGLFSLAAWRLGAEVVSVDVDKDSVGCANILRKNKKRWALQQGSILDRAFVKKIGKHDVVYSWGVLHHTGNMHAAFDNAAVLVKENGLLCIAIYNKNTNYIFEGTSRLWQSLKKYYNHTPKFIKKIMFYFYTSYLWLGLLVHGKNPVAYVRNYKSFRGMDFYADVRDWLGGYPYEYATTDEVANYFTKKGFVLVRQTTARSLGCNEFVFRRASSVFTASSDSAQALSSPQATETPTAEQHT